MKNLLNLFDDLNWEDAPNYPGGTKRKVLRDENGAKTMLLKLPKGFKMELHSHIVTVDCYLVYYGSATDSLFGFLGYTTDISYTHTGVAFFSDEMFYQITAYVGDMPTLRRIISKYEKIKMGEMEKFIAEEMKRARRK